MSNSSESLHTDPTETPDFEARLRQLEAIVEQLENDMPPLKEALASYEEGVTIARDCLEQLDQAELRIRNLKLEG